MTVPTRNNFAIFAVEIIGVALYLYLALSGLIAFPPYFFCDEAIHGLEAQSLLLTGADRTGDPWPLYFRGFGEFQWSASIYSHIPLIALRGLDVISVRATTALMSLIGVLALILIIRSIQFRAAGPTWVPYALGVSSLWFLHARTGFEVIQAVSFYFLFLAIYLKLFFSPEGAPSPSSLKSALLSLGLAMSAGISFYMYTPARGWILLSVLLFGLMNARTHLKLWFPSVLAIILFIIILSPYFVFQARHPEAAFARLNALGVHEVNELFSPTKFRSIAEQLLIAWDPRFWFTWSGTYSDGYHQRHTIPDSALFPTLLLPFLAIGAIWLIATIRQGWSRTIIAALLVAPIPAAIVETNSLRSMLTGCLYLLIALIGVQVVQSRGMKLVKNPGLFVFPTAALLSWQLLTFQQDTLHRSIHHYKDYRFYGLQYGAPQVMNWIKDHEREYNFLYLSNNSFNRAESLVEFFLPKDLQRRVFVRAVEDLCERADSEITASLTGTWIVPPDAFSNLTSKGCPLTLEHIADISDPNGQILFQIGTLGGGDRLPEFLAQQKILRRELRATKINSHHGAIEVAHVELDGSVEAIFDGDPYTLARTHLVNPMILQVQSGIDELQRINIFATHTRGLQITVAVQRTSTSKLETLADVTGNVAPDSDQISLQIPIAAWPERPFALRIEIRDVNADRDGYVHVNEIGWE